MKYLLWYLIGAGTVYGGYYYYTKVMKKDLCINDLPEPMKTQTLEAVKTNNKDKLLAYASQATDLGYNCAANEMRGIAVSIDTSKPKPVPTDDKKVTAPIKFVSNPNFTLATSLKKSTSMDPAFSDWGVDEA